MKFDYATAIHLALRKAMEIDKKVIAIGQGVTGEKGIFGTTKGLPNLLEFPICEEAMTGFAIGLATNGYKPVLSHIRLDFLVCSMNQIVNMADKYRQMFGNQYEVPLVIRGIIGRSWGQGSQHSGGFYPIFCHFPNINVYAPVTANDAYYSILNGINNKNPTIIIEHRKLYDSSLTDSCLNGVEKTHTIVKNKNPKLTLVGISRTAIDCYKTHYFFKSLGIDIDIIYPLSLNPLDVTKIVESAEKSKNILIVENSWVNCGISAEIIARLPPNISSHRMGFDPSSCPASSQLESLYYPEPLSIAKKVLEILKINTEVDESLFLEEIQKSTKGPF